MSHFGVLFIESLQLVELIVRTGSFATAAKGPHRMPSDVGQRLCSTQ
ncbi:MAG TPA: hypothetical protein VF534_21555 [Paraburkholderia sp.]